MCEVIYSVIFATAVYALEYKMHKQILSETNEQKTTKAEQDKNLSCTQEHRIMNKVVYIKIYGRTERGKKGGAT